jgi:hypothetical protein
MLLSEAGASSRLKLLSESVDLATPVGLKSRCDPLGIEDFQITRVGL